MKKIFLKKNFFIIFIFLIISFYFFYFLQNKNKIVLDKIDIAKKIGNEKEQSTNFFNFKHVYINSKGEKFNTIGEKASFKNDNRHLINLFKVHSYIEKKKNYLDIRSDKAQYNKKNNNIFYKENVIIKFEDKLVFADNANYYPQKNFIELIGNVIAKDGKTEIRSDMANLNTVNKNIEMIMNNEHQKIYGRKKK